MTIIPIHPNLLLSPQRPRKYSLGLTSPAPAPDNKVLLSAQVKQYLSQHRSSDRKLSASEPSQRDTETDCPRETTIFEMLDHLHLEEAPGSVPEECISLSEKRAEEASVGHATAARTSSDMVAGTPQIPHTLPSRGTTPKPVFTETPAPDPQRNQVRHWQD